MCLAQGHNTVPPVGPIPSPMLYHYVTTLPSEDNNGSWRGLVVEHQTESRGPVFNTQSPLRCGLERYALMAKKWLLSRKWRLKMVD